MGTLEVLRGEGFRFFSEKKDGALFGFYCVGLEGDKNRLMGVTPPVPMYARCGVMGYSEMTVAKAQWVTDI